MRQSSNLCKILLWTLTNVRADSHKNDSVFRWLSTPIVKIQELIIQTHQDFHFGVSFCLKSYLNRNRWRLTPQRILMGWAYCIESRNLGWVANAGARDCSFRLSGLSLITLPRTGQQISMTRITKINFILSLYWLPQFFVKSLSIQVTKVERPHIRADWVSHF